MPLSPKGFPVLLTFDLDAETMWTSRDPANAERPIILSQGAYGWKVGLGRILNLLARYRITATFFVPGLVIEQRPQAVERILEGGHEVAHHSWSHKWIVNMTEEEEREEMRKAFEIIETTTGRPPRGYRSPPPSSPRRHSPSCTSTASASPRTTSTTTRPISTRSTAYRATSWSSPFHWVLDDAPFFNYSITLPGRTMQAPSAVLEAWKAEFDTLYAEDRAFVLAMHPQIIGRPSRLVALEGLIRHIEAHESVWFGRCDHVADEIRPLLRSPTA